MSDTNNKKMNPQSEEYALSYKTNTIQKKEFSPAINIIKDSNIEITTQITQTEEEEYFFSPTVVNNSSPLHQNSQQAQQQIQQQVQQQVQQHYLIVPTTNSNSSYQMIPAYSQKNFIPEHLSQNLPFPQAGLTIPMMQQINNQAIKGSLEIEQSVAKYRRMNEEKLRQRIIFDDYTDSRKIDKETQSIDEAIIIVNPTLKELEDSFIRDYAVVKIRSQYIHIWKYAILDFVLIRHMKFILRFTKDYQAKKIA